MKAQESQKKLAGHDRGRQEKQKKPWRCQTQISQKNTKDIWISMHTAWLCSDYKREQGGQC